MRLISIINNRAVQAFAAHSFHCWNGSRQDIGHTLLSDPVRGAFHARGTLDLVVMGVQISTFSLSFTGVRQVFQGTTVPIRTRFSMTAAPLEKTTSEPSIHIRCRIVASFRATAIIAFFILLRLAIRRPAVMTISRPAEACWLRLRRVLSQFPRHPLW